MALSKAVIVNIDADWEVIPVMFNPPSYTLSRAVAYKEKNVPGSASEGTAPQLMEYISGTADGLSMALFFDTSDEGSDVRKRTSVIEDLLLSNPQTRKPPQLLLFWGSLNFKCYITNVNAEFDYFNGAGMPLRAKLQVTFTGKDEAGANANPNIVAPSSVQLPSGQSLADVATKCYQDPAKWRVLAQANSIDNPRKIAPGTELKLPRKF